MSKRLASLFCHLILLVAQLNLASSLDNSICQSDQKSDGDSSACGNGAAIANDQVLVMVKPDGVERGLVGEIVRRLEVKGFHLAAMKMMHADKALLEEHYAEHKGRPFFPSLIEFMSSGPVVPMVWKGKDIVEITRKMLGATSPKDSLPGTIRGDFGASKEKNLCHVSDSNESANREINLWFKSSELIDWEPTMKRWTV